MSLGDGLTWADWVRLVAAEHGVHDLSEDDIDVLLWERTAFPVAGPDHVRPQLAQLFAMGPAELRAALDALAEGRDR